jgi:hypothetical protein
MEYDRTVHVQMFFSNNLKSIPTEWGWGKVNTSRLTRLEMEAFIHPTQMHAGVSFWTVSKLPPFAPPPLLLDEPHDGKGVSQLSHFKTAVKFLPLLML